MSKKFSLNPADNKSNKLYGHSFLIIDEILNETILERNESASIIGETKSGKTSILKSIEKLIEDDVSIANIIPIYIDLKAYSYLDPDQIFKYFLEVIYAKRPELVKSSLSSNNMLAFSDLIICCERENLIILLLFDEFDHVLELKELNSYFFSFLRGTAKKNALSIITASRNLVGDICHNAKSVISASFFWDIFTNNISYLSCLIDESNARAMLNEKTVDEELISFLIENVNLNPYLLKLAYNTVEDNYEQYLNDKEYLISIFFEKNETHFEACTNYLELDDQNKRKGEAFKLNYIKLLNKIVEQKSYERSVFKKEINELKKKGFIYESGCTLKIFSPLYEKYLIEYFNRHEIYNQNPIAYNGPEPYIFVSYSHADSSIVLGQINKLQKEGFRVWYDEGIPTSGKWKKVIEEKIDNCKKFLFFNSINSSISPEVNEEIARFKELIGKKDYNQHFLMLILDDIKLCKSEKTGDAVQFVISDCNGLRIPIDEDEYFIRLINVLGDECKV